MTSPSISIDANSFAKCFCGMFIQLLSIDGRVDGGGITTPYAITIGSESLENCISLKAESDSIPSSTNSITLELTICGVGDLHSQDTTRSEWLASLTNSLESFFESYEKSIQR